ncbi:amino acid permease, partial [Turicimonas muris]
MGDTDRNKTSFTLSIGAMAMLTVCSVFSLRNLPSMAEYGWNIIFFLVASAVCFFVPSALVSAELASTYPERGGVFVWVREAFGPKYGFLAIFMEWVQNLPWYPAAATFVATCL